MNQTLCINVSERDAFDTLFDHAPEKLNVVKKVSSLWVQCTEDIRMSCHFPVWSGLTVFRRIRSVSWASSISISSGWISKWTTLSHRYAWVNTALKKSPVYSFTVLSRGVRSLFGPTRKSSPWGTFSDCELNQSIKRGLSLWTFRSIDWLIDWRKVNFDLIGLLDLICFYGGGAKVTEHRVAIQ